MFYKLQHEKKKKEKIVLLHQYIICIQKYIAMFDEK